MKSSNKIVRRNFIEIAVAIFAVILIAAILMHSYSARIIEKEFIKSNENNARILADRMDKAISECREIAAYLVINDMTQSFFASDNPGRIYERYYEQIEQLLLAYDKGIDFIDSVYLYSAVSNRILSSNGVYDAFDFSDNSWLTHLDDEKDGFILYPRMINEKYPFVYSVILHKTMRNIEYVIVININLQKLYKLISVGNDITQFILDRDGILVQRVMSELHENTHSVKLLDHFTPNGESNSFIEKATGTPYTYSQVYSLKYDLYFVTIKEQPEYLRELSKTRWLIIVVACFLLTLGLAVALLFCLNSFKPIRSIQRILESPDNWQDTQQKSYGEIQYICQRIVTNIQSNQLLKTELNTRLDLLNKTQLQALQLQINPHFLFNTINLISLQIADSQGYDYPAVGLLNDLSKLLRYSLESTDLVSLREEEQFTTCYLNLLQARYENTFDVEMNFDSSILNGSTPRLLIQPLIENAVFHGILQVRNMRRGVVDIRGSLTSIKYNGDVNETSSIMIKVSDNGCGIDNEALQTLREMMSSSQSDEGTHIGIKNVSRRLSLLHGDRFKMDISSNSGVGTEITVIFPYRKKD